jgi:hypothetical protein
MLKRWIWMGAFGPEAMLCAARVRIGALPVAWWAVWDRERGLMIQRSARGHGGVTASPAGLRVRGRTVRAQLAFGSAAPVELTSPHGASEIWTRKQAGVPVHGWVEVHGVRREVALRGVVDESAGRHARHTSWRWSAGVGTAASGAAVAWNLVDGLHDGPARAERAVWVDGVPHPVEPVAFAGLASVGPREPGSWRLDFAAEATRARRENLILVASDYEAPFGSFSGSLPVAGALREGWGVMERHEATW